MPVLKWLSANEPEVLAQAKSLLFCKDWIRLALTGEAGTDATDASFVPFDIRKRRWDAELFEMAGIADTTRLLPRIFDEGYTSPLLAGPADALGIPSGTPVGVGATDIVAGMVGGGAIRPGHALTILGTSANSSIVTALPQFAPSNVGIMAVAALGKFARTMINTSGSTTLDWAAQALTGGSVSQLVTLASTSDGDRDRPVLVPYLSSAGSVSPHPDPYARGTWAGLRIDHTPADLARTAIEGLGFAIAETYSSLNAMPTEITAVGGAARSELLLQTIADCTGATVRRPAGEEIGARGAALLAARGAGLLTDQMLAKTATMLVYNLQLEPASDAERVQAQFRRYRRVRDATSDLWPTW
jgi:sugar (pentulose or hexulose) kinase